jgi:hypothetical protein
VRKQELKPVKCIKSLINNVVSYENTTITLWRVRS